MKRSLFALAGLFAASASAQDPTDSLTLNCLIGYENDLIRASARSSIRQ